MKIEKLTKEQEDLLPVYRDKWLKIGLSTEPTNKNEAEKWCIEAYKVAGLEPPKQIIWATSPLAAGLTLHILKDVLSNNEKWDSVRDSVSASVWDSARDSVWDSVWDSVSASVRDSARDSARASVRASVRDSVWDSARDSVRASVWDSVWDSAWDSVSAFVWDSVSASVRDSVWDSVSASVWDSVSASVWDSVSASVRNSVGASGYGQHDAHWLGFYNYFQEVLDLESCNKLTPLMNLSKDCGWWLPMKEIAILEEKTSIVNLNESGLHCENGPALAYPDGFEIYALNGIRLPKEIVMTPANKLDANLILKEKNAEVRREIVRKIGIERIVRQLNAKVLDKWQDYELLELDLNDGRKRPYLKMINPSIGTTHIEGVDPNIKTVKQALAWRVGMEGEYIEPKILT